VRANIKVSFKGKLPPAVLIFHEKPLHGLCRRADAGENPDPEREKIPLEKE
jgi:hypothetical protein